LRWVHIITPYRVTIATESERGEGETVGEEYLSFFLSGKHT
jgi:hypothetical protein